MLRLQSSKHHDNPPDKLCKITRYIVKVYMAQRRINHEVSYPFACFVWKFHRSRHISSRPFSARKPSSFSAAVGSAVRSGTSPFLPVSDVTQARAQHAPSPDNLVLVLETGRLGHGVDHVQHAQTFTSTEVESAVKPVLLCALGEDPVGLVDRVEREDVTVGKVHDVEVVTHARSVTMIRGVNCDGADSRCGEVVAEHFEVGLDASDGDLG